MQGPALITINVHVYLWMQSPGINYLAACANYRRSSRWACPTRS